MEKNARINLVLFIFYKNSVLIFFFFVGNALHRKKSVVLLSEREKITSIINAHIINVHFYNENIYIYIYIKMLMGTHYCNGNPIETCLFHIAFHCKNTYIFTY